MRFEHQVSRTEQGKGEGEYDASSTLLSAGPKWIRYVYEVEGRKVSSGRLNRALHAAPSQGLKEGKTSIVFVSVTSTRCYSQVSSNIHRIHLDHDHHGLSPCFPSVRYLTLTLVYRQQGLNASVARPLMFVYLAFPVIACFRLLA